MAETTTVTVADIEIFKSKALYWANHFKAVCLLDSNNYPADDYHKQNWVLAVDATDELRCGPNAFDELKQFQPRADATIFGFLSYDLKNQIEKLDSYNFDGLHFPDLYFFKPRYVIEISGNKVTLNRNYPETFELIELINNLNINRHHPHNETGVKNLQPRTTKAKYLNNVQHIKQQIEDGDFYELNYCAEFFAEDVTIDAVKTFQKINSKARAPFTAFFKLNHKYLLCASPERFLKKEGNKLISQPIKGTIEKGKNLAENEGLKKQLQADVKERAENVMIVDLVRNDLAHSAKAGSVKVEELFGVYEFNTVNQMISTVVAELRSDVHFVDAIKNAFPMGSMTGAPKVEVMKNIEHYEDFKRGLYSGAVGYITASGDFDFNVVIRSILYNQQQHYLSVRAGGAITYDSVPEKEYNEMLLKAQAMLDVLKD